LKKVTLKSYLIKKQELELVQKKYRVSCECCKKSSNTCYCKELIKYEPETKFVILIHKEEVRRSVATGRMAHLSLKGSVLFRGNNFTEHEELNQILQNPDYYSVLLYPGKKSETLSFLAQNIPSGRKLVVIILDATWHEARRMFRFSTNLHHLPMVSFTPETPSQFQVRKQPHSNCYSTIEAIQYVLRLLEPSRNYEGLLESFKFMVQTQLHFEVTGGGRHT